MRIRSALISVYHKEGLEQILQHLHDLQVDIYSTGGTHAYIEAQGIPVQRVEDLTGYPSILDGRVKTLHPKVFGGILARREAGHTEQLVAYDIPAIDLVIVDLYPFEDTVRQTDDEATIIEKIDIGGISLIRAAAKNFKDVLIVPSQAHYALFLDLLDTKQGHTDLDDRRAFAQAAFSISAHYDTAIYQYFAQDELGAASWHASFQHASPLRYGENPHQRGYFYGRWTDYLKQLQGKALSYNNLVDIDAAVQLMAEFGDADPTFAVLKHTNACGVATRKSVGEAWEGALAGDPISAFGGILISNANIDASTAEAINTLFYEVLIAPDFTPEAIDILSKKKKRILLQLLRFPAKNIAFKSLLDGVIVQDLDRRIERSADLQAVTKRTPTAEELNDLVFANICAKHLKSNTIVLAKNQQLLGMGCGQTSRVDACGQAIEKAGRMGFDLQGAVMASDAFFPFPDCVELAHRAGITAVVQPGGSIKDQLSIDFCDAHDVAMVFTGHRHFKH